MVRGVRQEQSRTAGVEWFAVPGRQARVRELERWFGRLAPVVLRPAPGAGLDQRDGLGVGVSARNSGTLTRGLCAPDGGLKAQPETPGPGSTPGHEAAHGHELETAPWSGLWSGPRPRARLCRGERGHGRPQWRAVGPGSCGERGDGRSAAACSCCGTRWRTGHVGHREASGRPGVRQSLRPAAAAPPPNPSPSEVRVTTQDASPADTDCYFYAWKPSHSSSRMTGTGGIESCSGGPVACTSEVDLEYYDDFSSMWLTAGTARQSLCAPPLRSSTASASCVNRPGDPNRARRTTTYGTLVSSGGSAGGGTVNSLVLYVPCGQWEVGGPGCRRVGPRLQAFHSP